MDKTECTPISKSKEDRKEVKIVGSLINLRLRKNKTTSDCGP